jgi:hypothetical protein
METPIEHVNQNLRLIASPHPLSAEKDRIDRTVPEGGTVGDHIRGLGWTTEGLSARVFLDGELVQDAAWEYTVPHAGQALVVRAIPTGGPGGGKTALRIVSMIALMAAAVFTGGAEVFAVGGALAGWGGAAAVGISLIGTLALNGLLPVPLPRRALPRPIEDQRKEAA